MAAGSTFKRHFATAPTGAYPPEPAGNRLGARSQLQCYGAELTKPDQVLPCFAHDANVYSCTCVCARRAAQGMRSRCTVRRGGTLTGMHTASLAMRRPVGPNPSDGPSSGSLASQQRATANGQGLPGAPFPTSNER
jgi:hypothetical protein